MTTHDSDTESDARSFDPEAGLFDDEPPPYDPDEAERDWLEDQARHILEQQEEYESKNYAPGAESIEIDDA